MKRIVTCLLGFILFAIILIPAPAWAAEPAGRVIHVVYDDSGSMIRDNARYVDRWCQAKYAMEAFAAMLGEQDSMLIYYMSDFDLSAGGKIDAPAKIVVSGSEPMEARVSKIHDTVTRSANTPYDSVAKAYADLAATDAGEKWLVVLTDGMFNRLDGRAASRIDVNGYFSQYALESSVRIAFIAMGDAAPEIDADPTRGIYYERAADSADIPGVIISLCNRMFNRKQLPFDNEQKLEFSFDIPMEEILVFAQGDAAIVNSVRSGDVFIPNAAADVRYSEIAAVNYQNDANVEVARGLSGSVASFQDLPPGAYTLDAAGARTVAIYYKPTVENAVKLYQNGEEILEAAIPEGEYQIQFGIMGENGQFIEPRLLGKVEHEATLLNGGRTYTINNGDTVNLVRGEMEVHLVSRYWETGTVKNTLARLVEKRPPPPLELDIAVPNGPFTVSNLDSTGAFIVTVRHQGQLLTESQWLNMPLPTITTAAKVDLKGLRRGSDVSTFIFYTKQKDENKYATATGNVIFRAAAEMEYDEQTARGENTAIINIKDDVGWWARFLDWMGDYTYLFLVLAVLLFGLLLIY